MSLTGFMRESNTPDYDPVRFGREWVVIEELALHRGLATRDRDANEERHIDVDYPVVHARPGRNRRRRCAIVSAFEFDDASRQAVQQWIDDHPQDTARRAPLHRRRLRSRPRPPARPLRLLHPAVPVISGERILVTGVTGTIGSALALHLAAENEVWGVARFADCRHPSQGDVHRGRDAVADPCALDRARSSRPPG